MMFPELSAECRWYAVFTEDAKHLAEFHRLQQQFSPFFDIIGIPIERNEDWMTNCLQRSQKIAEEARTHPDKTIGLLDTDLTVFSEPKMLMEPFQGDILINDLKHNNPNDVPIGRRYSAGIIAFSPTHKSREVLFDWANSCKLDDVPSQGLREQFYLFRSIERLRPRITPLDTKYYNHVPVNGRVNINEVVILHTRDPRWFKFGEEIKRQIEDDPQHRCMLKDDKPAIEDVKYLIHPNGRIRYEERLGSNGISTSVYEIVHANFPMPGTGSGCELVNIDLESLRKQRVDVGRRNEGYVWKYWLDRNWNPVICRSLQEVEKAAGRKVFEDDVHAW